jgi:hypothetical protein
MKYQKGLGNTYTSSINPNLQQAHQPGALL